MASRAWQDGIHVHSSRSSFYKSHYVSHDCIDTPNKDRTQCNDLYSNCSVPAGCYLQYFGGFVNILRHNTNDIGGGAQMTL